MTVEDTEPLDVKYNPLRNDDFRTFLQVRHTSGIWGSVDDDCAAYDEHVATKGGDSCAVASNDG